MIYGNSTIAYRKSNVVWECKCVAYIWPGAFITLIDVQKRIPEIQYPILRAVKTNVGRFNNFTCNANIYAFFIDDNRKRMLHLNSNETFEELNFSPTNKRISVSFSYIIISILNDYRKKYIVKLMQIGRKW